VARNPFQWFPFYASDWLSDERVQVIPLESQGAYIRLLATQWVEGSIPQDDYHLSRLLGIPHSEWLEFSHEVRQFFVDAGEGRLKNERLESERDKQLRHHKRLSTAGKAGARKTNNRRVYNGVSGQAEATPAARPSASLQPGFSQLESESESESYPPSPPPPRARDDRDFVPPEFRTDEYRVVLATITVLEKLSGVTFTPEDRAAVATAHVGKSESQVAEALKRIAESYRAGTIRNLPRYAAEVISKQPPVRTERDAEEAKTIQRAQRLCADLAVPWKHYNAQAMAAVTQHNGAVKAAVEATWADHHAKLFTSDSPAVWWDRFTQHLDAPEVVS